MITNLEKFVPVFTVESWEDFDKLFRDCGPVVFRGHGDSSWELKTNYERKFGTNVSRESSMLCQCIAEGHLFVDRPPVADDYVSWMAEMQHYGASTRLLDVSRSKYIALFFALMGMDGGKDGAVWAFDTVRADQELYNKLSAGMSVVKTQHTSVALSDGIMPYIDTGWKIANAVMGCEPAGKISTISKDLNRCKALLNSLYKQGLIVHVAPKRMNRRLLAQQGEFLFPLNIRKTYVQNLLGPIGGNTYSGTLCEFGNVESRNKARKTLAQSVIKVIVPHVLKEEFVDRLLEMNITYQTLFPDETGFMKSLSFQRNKKRSGLKLCNVKGQGLVCDCNEFLK